MGFIFLLHIAVISIGSRQTEANAKAKKKKKVVPLFLANNQLDALFHVFIYLFIYLFILSLYMFRASSAHHQEIELYKICPESNETDFLGQSRMVGERSLRA